MKKEPINPESFRSQTKAFFDQVKRVIVGQDELVELTLVTLLAGGNALLEGVPGLGKTILVRTLAQAIQCQFSRIQFTPDLMPSDIVGTNLVVENEDGSRQFQFEAGPIFSNLVLADEINRATPKTQSAMLEAMQEHSVTVAKITRPLPEPFFVLATQNPIEMVGAKDPKKPGMYNLKPEQVEPFKQALGTKVAEALIEKLGAESKSLIYKFQEEGNKLVAKYPIGNDPVESMDCAPHKKLLTYKEEKKK